MKKYTLLATAMLLAVISNSQQVLYEDDFESYPLGSYIAAANSEWWTTWNNAPGTGEDCVVSGNFVKSGSQSIYVTWEDGITDALLKLGDKTSGAYELDWYMYVEEGYGSYYNVQHFEAPGQEWAFEVYFYPFGTGKLTVGSMDYPFTYTQNTWFRVKHEFYLDDDLAILSIAGNVVHSWPFHYQNYSLEGTRQLGGVDFNDNTNFRSYIDDVQYTELDLTGIISPKSASREFTLSISPNPASDRLNVSSAEAIREIEILNQYGQRIYRQEAGNTNLTINLYDYASGIYFVRARSEKGISTQKFIVH